MMRFAALSLAAAQIALADPLGCSSFTESAPCKEVKGCKWSKGNDLCYNKELGIPAPTPAPTEPPTDSPTDAPTAEPTMPPTDSPTSAPTDEVDPVPTGPFEQADCGQIDAKSACNRTPTCVYKNKEESCATCDMIESRNSCEDVVGCMWKQKHCVVDTTDPHPNDGFCSPFPTKRECRRMNGCQWNRNGKCTGHLGCEAQKNMIDCRGANKCFWKPNANVCVEQEDAVPVTPLP